MKLFKYLKKQHLENLFDNGEFRIGTLHDYRNVTNYGTEIGEGNEGSINLDFDAWEGRELELSSNSYEAALLRSCLNLKPGDPYLKNRLKFGKGTRIVVNLNSINGFIYCTTTEFNKNVMESFECDCCVEIFDPLGFFDALSREISNKARFVREGTVVYKAREQNYRFLKDFHPAMIKPIEYQHQKEHRIIWESITSSAVEPFFAYTLDATKYCRKLKI